LVLGVDLARQAAMIKSLQILGDDELAGVIGGADFDGPSLQRQGFMLTGVGNSPRTGAGGMLNFTHRASGIGLQAEAGVGGYTGRFRSAGGMER
jgi:hypothetical protein